MREALVIGGGLAGGALATHLANAGTDVRLVERETAPRDKVCGDFLSHEAVHYLDALGVDPLSLGGESIHKLRLGRGAGVVESTLPFAAASVSRCVLDDALLERATLAGAEVRRGQQVNGLRPSPQGGWIASVAGGEEIRAKTVFIATGKRDVRGHGRGAGGHDDLVAFKAHFRLRDSQRRALKDHVELALFPGGYAGLSLIEGERANLCLLVRRERLSELGGQWSGVLASVRAGSNMIEERLDGAVQQENRPLALSAIPYGYTVGGAPPSPAGLWRLGDQAAVIPSFSGDGMSIALHSATLAAQMYNRGASQDAFHRALADDVASSMRLALPLSKMLVNPTSQAFAFRVARWFPQVMSKLAHYTRVPESAVQRAGVQRSTGAAA